MYCKNFFLFAMVLSAMVYFSPAEARDGRGGGDRGGRELYPGGGMESEHRERDDMYQDHRGYGDYHGAGAAYEAGQTRGYNTGSANSSAQYMPQYNTMPPAQQQPQQPAQQPYPYYEQPYQPRM